MSSRAQRLKQEALERVGEQLPGGWTLKELIGFGGAAAVYSAIKAPQQIAVKILHTEYVGHEVIEQRFEREAQIAMSLDHPHILKVFGYDRLSSGQLYMRMELLEGINVQQYLHNHGDKLSVSESLMIAQQVLLALEHCHAAGITHRDLKPSNLFISRSRQIKVLDFGVARQESSDAQLTMEGTALGTPSFMPPEQARGRLELLDARSDLFALGATLYTMLTGELLHKGSNAEESLILAATKPAESIARVAPTLPGPIIALVDKALTWSPSKRFQSAALMREALEQSLESAQGQSQRPNTQRAAMAEALLESSEALAQDDPELKALDEAEVDRSLLKAIEHAFGQAERYMAAIRQYSEEHAETKKYKESAYQTMVEVLARLPTNQLILKILPHSLQLEQEVVWEPMTPFDQIPYNLFSSGLRRITLLGGLEREEYMTLLDIFQMDPQRDLAPEDDLSTVLWQKELPHLQLQLVSTFQLDDAKDQEQFLEDCAQEQARMEPRHKEALGLQLERTRMLLSVGAEALAEAQGLMHRSAMSTEGADVLTPTDEGLIKFSELRQLKAALERSNHEVEQRLPWVLYEALQESTRGHDQEMIIRAARLLMGRTVQAWRVLKALELYGRVMQCLESREQMVALTQQLMSEDVILRLLMGYGDWIEAAESSTQREAALDERNLRYLKELLQNIDATYMPAVAQLYTRGQRERPVVILCYGYLKRHSQGHEEIIGELLAQLPVGHCRKMIELLIEGEREAGYEALRHADKNPDAALRLAVLELRAKHQPDRVWQQLASLASESDAHLRVRALQVATKYKVTGLAPFLQERISSDGFFDLPYSERRLLLMLLLSQEPKLAYRVSLELLKSHGLVANDTRNTTRILAVEVLAHLPITPEVVAALQEATKRRWWNSKELQESSAALLERHFKGSRP